MYTLFSEKKVPSVKKEDEPENPASKLRGNWMFGINPTSNTDKLPLRSLPERGWRPTPLEKSSPKNIAETNTTL